MLRIPVLTTFCSILLAGASSFAVEPANLFQEFVLKQASKYRENDRPIASSEDWDQRRTKLRQDLLNAWGGFPSTACDLDPRKIGELQRDGYRVEKLAFQTRPGIFMTANAYVPDNPGKLPAVLHVHGHWKGAKQDPVVQSRCIGCAKLGFFVLCVDAFGAGERAIEKKLGEYHGEMTAATLIPIGMPLAGLQVYENMRAVDYLISRPEVDPLRIGITGASGGGNQSMYAGAFDERFHCVVPTCSVGTYQSYLKAACCLCELVPGGLKFTEEGDILGLAANRGLMVTSATKDAFQFSVGEAKKSFAQAEAISRLFPGAIVRHTIIESPHDYNQQMREAMYGWMTRQLKNEGDGSPIPEPPIQTENPEVLRCFPGNSRPDDFTTIPQFAAAEAVHLAQQRPIHTDRSQWEQNRRGKCQKLIDLLGGLPAIAPLNLKMEDDARGKFQTLTFESEPGLPVVALRDQPENRDRIAIVINLDGEATLSRSSDLANQLRTEGWAIVAPDLRATGRFAIPHDKIANAIDHNSSEWAMWIGRPLLGQWVHDVRRTLDAIAQRDDGLPKEVLVVGRGSSGVVALTAAALDERISQVRVIESLATYVTDKPYRDVRLGLMVPGILRDFGDIADIAALVAPRRLTIRGGKSGTGIAIDQNHLAEHYAATKRVFELLEVPQSFAIEFQP